MNKYGECKSKSGTISATMGGIDVFRFSNAIRMRHRVVRYAFNTRWKAAGTCRSKCVTKYVEVVRPFIVKAAKVELQSAAMSLFFYAITRLVNDRNREIGTMPLFSCHIRRTISERRVYPAPAPVNDFISTSSSCSKSQPRRSMNVPSISIARTRLCVRGIDKYRNSRPRRKI